MKKIIYAMNHGNCGYMLDENEPLDFVVRDCKFPESFKNVIKSMFSQDKNVDFTPNSVRLYPFDRNSVVNLVTNFNIVDDSYEIRFIYGRNWGFYKDAETANYVLVEDL